MSELVAVPSSTSSAGSVPAKMLLRITVLEFREQRESQ